MEKLFEDTEPRTLTNLLMLAHTGDLGLPDFQRDFVWDPSATAELLESIANQHPAGSLLAIHNREQLFGTRPIAGVPATGKTPMLLLLDGQQRTTSLYQAFYGAGDHLYWLNLKLLAESGDFGEALSYTRRDAKRGQAFHWNKRYATFENQANHLILPLAELYGEGRLGFNEWMRRVRKTKPTTEEQDGIEDLLGGIRDTWIEQINRYEFPWVLLNAKTKPDAICTIFETLNRTGVKLGPFDLLEARFRPKGLSIRELWAKTREEHAELVRFDVDPYYVLQVLALLRTDRAPSCKASAVMDLKAEHVREHWDLAAASMAKGLKLLEDDCGVLLPKWLPYATQLVPLAAMFASNAALKGLAEGDMRRKITRWFWCAVFSSAYGATPNTQSERDMQEVNAWISGKAEPRVVRDFEPDFDKLEETTPKERAVYRGLICAVLSKGPRDFHTFRPLERNLVEANEVDDHHLFPQAYLATSGVPEGKDRDTILNRTLIDRATNQRILKAAPADYLGVVGQTHDLKVLLESHQIDEIAQAALRANDFAAFKEARKATLGKLMIEKAGWIKPASVQ
jgi:hypothetical protein